DRAGIIGPNPLPGLPLRKQRIRAAIPSRGNRRVSSSDGRRMAPRTGTRNHIRQRNDRLLGPPPPSVGRDRRHDLQPLGRTHSKNAPLGFENCRELEIAECLSTRFHKCNDVSERSTFCPSPAWL